MLEPVAITYVSGGRELIYVFAKASTGHLVVNYWTGTAPWHWADLGLPAGVSGVGPPTAITYQSGGQQWIYVFAEEENNGHLVVNCGIAPPAHRDWEDQGLPAGSNGVAYPSATTYLNSLGTRLINVFGETQNQINHDLVVNS